MAFRVPRAPFELALRENRELAQLSPALTRSRWRQPAVAMSLVCTATPWSPTTWTGPDAEGTNLALLCHALKGLRSRRRLPGFRGGVKIDGGRLEPRNLQADSIAVGSVTAIGNIDIVLQPRGFEAGYRALSPQAVTMS